jgi:anti-sigma28 factor (negative regulator of flagellin synthesis)
MPISKLEKGDDFHYMKINDPTSAGLSATKLSQSLGVGTAARNGRAGSVQGDNEDHVRLSNLASVVQSLSGDSPDRAARVERLAMQVQSGQYQVDSMALSSKIVGAALQGF